MANIIKLLGQLLGGAAFFLFFISLILGRADMTNESAVVFTASLLFFSSRYVIMFILMTSYGKTHVFQAMVVTTGCLIWFMIALLSPYTLKSHVFIILVEAITLLLVALFWYGNFFRLCNFSTVKQTIINRAKNNRGCLICVIYTLLLSLSTLKWIPIWEDLQFTKDLIVNREFDFTPSSIGLINGTMSEPVILLLFPGIEISGANPYLSIRFCILLYLLIDSVLIYFLFKKMLPSLSNIELTIISLAFLSYTPIIGTQSPNPDYIGILVLISMVFFFYYKYYFLFLINAFLLCLTKETLAVLYAGFVMGIVINWIIRKNNDNIKSYFRHFLILLLPVIMWFAILCLPRLMTGTFQASEIFGREIENSAEEEGMEQQNDEDNTDKGLNHIIGSIDSIAKPKQSTNGFYSRYPFEVSKLVEMFAFHFLWIPFLLVLLFLNKRTLRSLTYMLPVVFAIVFTTIINCVIHTYDIYRNVVPGNILVLIVSFVVICFNIEKKSLRNRFIIIIGVLFVIEQFMVIDPLTLFNRDVYSSGNGKIVYLDTENNKNLYISPMIQINRQSYEYGNFIEAILKAIDYDEKTLIIIPEMKEKENSMSMRGVFGKGFWYDKKQKKLITIPDMSEAKIDIQWGSLSYNGDVNIVGKDKSEIIFDRVFLIIFPFIDNEYYIEALFYQELEMISSQEVKYGDWIATVIELKDIDLFYLEKRMEEEESNNLLCTS